MAFKVLNAALVLILPALCQSLRVANYLIGVLLILLMLLLSFEEHLFQPAYFQIGLITYLRDPIVSRQLLPRKLLKCIFLLIANSSQLFAKSLVLFEATVILSHIGLQLHLLLIALDLALTLNLPHSLTLILQPAAFALQLQHFLFSLALLLSHIPIELIVSLCGLNFKSVQLLQ